jgi:type I restriction enzyme S subunit
MIQQVSKRYDAYRDSGVDWLGEIPEEWKVMRLKDLIARLESGVSVNASDEPAEGNNIGVLKTSCVGKDTFQYSQNKTVWPTEVDRVCVPVRAGRIIISRMNTPELVGASSYITKDYPNLFLPDRLWQTVFYRNKKLNTKWLSFLIGCKNFRFVLSTVATGTSPSMKNLGQEKFLSIGFPYPSLSEQNAIADYLNEKTAKIDQQIDLLTQKAKHYGELKQALINETVTRGLDKTVPMKDSGIEWIGDIPAHWEVKRIKDITLVKRGASPRPIDNPIYFDADGEFSWVRIADLSASERYLLSTKEKLSKLGATLSVKRYPGHFILSIAGTVGKPIITKIKCCIHDGFVWFPTLKINAEYLYYIFSTGLPYQGLGKLGTQLNLNTETVGLISIPFPSENEINKIIDYLDDKTAQIDTIVKAINAQIDNLKALRKTLINDVVTGKICIL